MNKEMGSAIIDKPAEERTPFGMNYAAYERLIESGEYKHHHGRVVIIADGKVQGYSDGGRDKAARDYREVTGKKHIMTATIPEDGSPPKTFFVDQN